MMNQKKIAFEQRLELNSKNYHPDNLFDMKAAGEFLAQMYESFGLCTLMTDRHGNILMVNGDFGDFDSVRTEIRLVVINSHE